MHIGDILISLVGVSFAMQCPPKKGHRGGDSRQSFVTLDSQAMEQKSQTHRNLRDPSAFDKKQSDCGIMERLSYESTT